MRFLFTAADIGDCLVLLSKPGSESVSCGALPASAVTASAMMLLN